GDFLHGPDTDPATVTIIRERSARAEGFQVEIVNYGKNGRRYWMAIDAQPVRDERGQLTNFVMVQTDITARKESERALRESEAKFRSLTELNSDWYWEQDAELRFVGPAGGGDRRGGITSDQRIGRRRWELPGTSPLNCTWEEHKAMLAARQ